MIKAWLYLKLTAWLLPHKAMNIQDDEVLIIMSELNKITGFKDYLEGRIHYNRDLYFKLSESDTKGRWLCRGMAIECSTFLREMPVAKDKLKKLLEIKNRKDDNT